MYLASEALRLLVKDKAADLSGADIAVFNRYKQSLDNATKFIPTWVKSNSQTHRSGEWSPNSRLRVCTIRP